MRAGDHQKPFDLSYNFLFIAELGLYMRQPTDTASNGTSRNKTDASQKEATKRILLGAFASGATRQLMNFSG